MASQSSHPGSPTWGTLDPNRPRRRHSSNAAITFLEEKGSHTPPYVLSPVSTRRSSSEAGTGADHEGGAYAADPHFSNAHYAGGEGSSAVQSTPHSFLARFQSNIQQMSVAEPSIGTTLITAAHGAETGMPLPLSSPHAQTREAVVSSCAVSSPANDYAPSGHVVTSGTAVTVAPVGRTLKSRRPGGWEGTSSAGGARRAAAGGSLAPLASAALGYLSGPGSTLNTPMSTTSAAGVGAAAATGHTPITAATTTANAATTAKTRQGPAAMSAEVFSEALLPATEFLQHTVRKQEEAQAESAIGTVGPGGATRTARRSLAAATVGGGAGGTVAKPASAAIAMLERGLADDATTLHRQRERNEYYIRKHMQNVDAARESQQELKSFERTLRKIEDRNTVTVRRHRTQRKTRSGAAVDDDDDGEDDADDDAESGNGDAEEANRASNRAATDRTLHEAAESWAVVQRLQVENPNITRTLQQEVQSSHARLAASRTRRVDADNLFETEDPAMSASRCYPRPPAMDEPAEISWGGVHPLDAHERPSERAETEGTVTTVAKTGVGSRNDALVPSSTTPPQPQYILTRADAVIDAYLGQAGTGLRSVGKPRGSGTTSRSIEEQLQVLLEYGNGASVSQGKVGGRQTAPTNTRKRASVKRTVKRASSSAPTSGTNGSERCPRLPALLSPHPPEAAPSSCSTRRPSSAASASVSSPPVRTPLDTSAEGQLDDSEIKASAPSQPSLPAQRPSAAMPSTASKHVRFSHVSRNASVPNPVVPVLAQRENSVSAADTTTTASQQPFSQRVSVAAADTPTTEESRANRHGKTRKRFKRAPKGREALPVALGVANRAAATLQHEILTTRRQNLEMEVSKACDVTRSVQLLRALQPLRESLLQRDVMGGASTNAPSAWPALYDTARQGAGESPPAGGGASAISAGVLPRLPAPARKGAATTTTRGGGGEDSGALVPRRTEAEAYGDALPTWATPQQVIDAHQAIILGKAREMDANDRQDARLLYVGVLRVMCLERVPPPLQPAVLETLAHAHRMLEEGPHMQTVAGFKAAVTAHIPNQQLVAWPVQEVLQHLANLYKVPQTVFKDWLGNVFVQLGNRHDYEARFRLVDRTIKGRDIPQEANVRLTLHLCRRLPRVFLLSAATTNSANALMGVAGGSIGSGRGNGVPQDTDDDIEDSLPPLTPAGRSVADDVSGLGHTTAPTLAASTATGPHAFSPTSTMASPLHGGAGLAGLGVSPSVPGQHEYAIRIKAERQTITSSAIPAGTGVSGATNKTGAAGQGRDGSAGAGRSGSAAVGASKRVVNLADQTFKLHLYDTASQIELTLLQDGQPIAIGRFTVQRYGNARATQLWLPLQVNAGASPTSRSGSNGDGRTAELKLTVEVMHDKQPASNTAVATSS